MILTVFFIYKSRRYLLPSFTSFGILIQEKNLKIHFQDGCLLRFRIRLILASFDLQVNRILPTKFGVSWSFGSGEVKINFQDRRPSSWISDQNSLAYYDLQVAPILPTKLESISPGV